MTSDVETVICGRAYVDGRLGYAEVGITGDGVIAEVGPSVSGSGRRIDLGTSIVMVPGFVDPHVHLRDPGMTHKEDFPSGTSAAVRAGVTCVLDMPNTIPPVTDVASMRAKGAAVRGRAYADYGLFAAVTADVDPVPLAPMAVGFKLFMGSTTGDILLDDDESMVPAVGRVLATGRRMSVHAEDDRLIARGPESCCADHLRNRPAEAEWNAISRLASRFAGSRINICHITTPEGLDLARAAGFSTEVTMHHMTFDADGFPGAEYKVNPPLRDAATRDALRARFLAGGFDMLGTDHAPHTSEEKGRGFAEAPSGIPGVETAVPMLMDMVRRGDLPIAEAVRMGSENPARLFDIGKGRIAPGYDADLAFFDLRLSVPIDAASMLGRSGHTPYAGSPAVYPLAVCVRGSLQVRDGEFCGEPIGRDVRGLRGGLLRDRRQGGRVPAAVRHVLPVPARGPPG